ncbi:hypothetical protein FM996_13785 [Methylosinus sporium]|uniref:DUF1254 domain-containing protein n=1 Tax=Methylosinus sporium TaxID=428 RepID=A0A549SNZ3_METSR|nr:MULTISPECIES: hypothetical protein [Methylosinus]MBU3887469.1 hypothetical protein [Methylosinus sp. KRF6]TRL31341.1 hypothetical protein FM996_13785 [Methylosinus sporium]
MKTSRTYLDWLPWALATVCVAGSVHIVSVLLMPELAPRNAYARLAAAAQSAETTPNGVALLPRAAPGAEVMPFEDSAFVDGVCLFDLSKGMMRVRADADPEELIALSFHARTGRVFHSATDRSAIKGKIDVLVGDARQIEAVEGEDEEAPPSQVHVTAPSMRGFVLMRSLAKRASDRDRAEQRLRSVSCETVAAPES